MNRMQIVLYAAAFAIVILASLVGESLLTSGIAGILTIVAVLVVAVSLVYAAERSWDK